MDLIIRQAKSNDLEEIEKLLIDNNLPAGDLKESNVLLFVGLINDRIVACAGLEKYGSIGLLRSLAVNSDYRNRKIGDRLVKHLFNYCDTVMVDELYLLTTTADRYFKKYGFVKVDRDKVPESIKQTQEFKNICPASAVVMKKLI